MRSLPHLAAMAAGLALGGIALAAPCPAAAQPQTTGPFYRFTFEGYVSGMSMDTDASGRVGQGGFGLRALFNHSDLSRAARTFFDRASVGAFWTHGKNGSVSTDHVGGELDVAILPTAINGIFDPFFSLGAGVVHGSAPSGVAGAKLTSSDFALTPAAGFRIPFLGGIGARADLRMPIVFGVRKTVNFAAEGGLFLSF